jgi:hypothetical protein
MASMPRLLSGAQFIHLPSLALEENGKCSKPLLTSPSPWGLVNYEKKACFGVDGRYRMRQTT